MMYDDALENIFQRQNAFQIGVLMAFLHSRLKHRRGNIVLAFKIRICNFRRDLIEYSSVSKSSHLLNGSTSLFRQEMVVNV